MSELELVPVQEYFDRARADLAVSVLEASGIRATVFGDDMGGMRPDFAMVGRVRVLVQKEKQAEAKRILTEYIGCFKTVILIWMTPRLVTIVGLESRA